MNWASCTMVLSPLLLMAAGVPVLAAQWDRDSNALAFIAALASLMFLPATCASLRCLWMVTRQCCGSPPPPASDDGRPAFVKARQEATLKAQAAAGPHRPTVTEPGHVVVQMDEAEPSESPLQQSLLSPPKEVPHVHEDS